MHHEIIASGRVQNNRPARDSPRRFDLVNAHGKVSGVLQTIGSERSGGLDVGSENRWVFV
jgi:hypothetical protein